VWPVIADDEGVIGDLLPGALVSVALSVCLQGERGSASQATEIGTENGPCVLGLVWVLPRLSQLASTAVCIGSVPPRVPAAVARRFRACNRFTASAAQHRLGHQGRITF